MQSYQFLEGDDETVQREWEADLLAAAERTSFQLTYSRATTPRKFNTSGISGDDITDAYNPTRTSLGEWCADWNMNRMVNPQAWFREFFAHAVAEATHEVMEWFQVDGKHPVNPHAEDEAEIIEKCIEFARTLWDAHATQGGLTDGEDEDLRG